MRTYLKVAQFLVLVAAIILVAVVGFGAYVGIGSLTACAVTVAFGLIGCLYVVPAIKYQSKAVSKVKPLVDDYLYESYTEFMVKKQA